MLGGAPMTQARVVVGAGEVFREAAASAGVAAAARTGVETAAPHGRHLPVLRGLCGRVAAGGTLSDFAEAVGNAADARALDRPSGSRERELLGVRHDAGVARLT